MKKIKHVPRPPPHYAVYQVNIIRDQLLKILKFKGE
jgi:hypothetical protein